MSRTPKVDASKAIKALGIKHPVHFVSRNLNQGLSPEVAGAIFGGTTQGRTESDDTVALDWDALAYQQSIGELPMYADPRNVIAHELIHVKQIQEAGGYEAAAEQYAKAGTLEDGRSTYESNPFEQEAFAHSADIAPLVKVTP